MLVAIVFAQVWGVLQLIVLGSVSRTTRVRTVLAGIAVGLYACAPLALLLQLSWIGVAAALTGTSRYAILSIAGYTVDPFIEEVVKVLPVALLLLVPVVRRQWSITDCVLLGAAAGSGFGLAEDLYRYSAAPHLAIPNDAGWGLATGISVPQVPSVGTTLMSWLPPGTAAGDLFSPGEGGYPWVNLHLAWSAIAGLAVGVIGLRKGTAARVAGIALLLYVGLDHAAWNARSQGSWVSDLIVSPFAAVRDVLGCLPIAALAAAWWFDRGRQHGGDAAEPVLHAEQSASPRWVGTLRAALSRLPGSAASVYGLLRLRRAYSAARASGPREDSNALRSVVVTERDRIDQELIQPQLRPLLPLARTRSVVLNALRQPAAIVGLALIAPAFLWYVVGGWPRTAWLQTTLSAPLAWNVARVLSLAAQAWLAWRLFIGARSWLTTLRLPVGDEAAILGLRLACGVGALSLGGYALLRSFSVYRPETSLALAMFDHVAQAYGGLGVVGALTLTGGPPLALDRVFGSGSGYTGGGGESSGGGSGDSYGSDDEGGEGSGYRGGGGSFGGGGSTDDNGPSTTAGDDERPSRRDFPADPSESERQDRRTRTQPKPSTGPQSPSEERPSQAPSKEPSRAPPRRVWSDSPGDDTGPPRHAVDDGKGSSGGGVGSLIAAGIAAAVAAIAIAAAVGAGGVAVAGAVTALAVELLSATTAANNGGKFIQAVTTLSGLLGLTAAQKADVIKELMRQIGFRAQSIIDKGSYIELVSEDGLFIFRVMADSTKVMYGKLNLQTLEYIWKSL